MKKQTLILEKMFYDDCYFYFQFCDFSIKLYINIYIKILYNYTLVKIYIFCSKYYYSSDKRYEIKNNEKKYQKLIIITLL